MSETSERKGAHMPLITGNPAAAGNRLRGRYLVVLISGVAVAAMVAACGGGSGAGPAAAGTTTDHAGSTARGGGASGAGAFPGGPAASGKIAAVASGSIEVQSAVAGQLTVDYSRSTRITQSVTGSLADIRVGSCITAIDATESPVTSGSSAPASPPRGTASVSPTTITIEPATSGGCARAGAFGGGGFGRSGGSFTSGTSVPSARPSAFSSGGRGEFRGGALAGAITSGKVTAISGDSIAVAAVNLFSRTGSSPSASASPTTTAKTVTVGASTKIIKTAVVTAAALKVGLCASAQGTTDTTGMVAATSIALSSPDASGSCEAAGGLGGRFGRGGPGGGATGSNG